MSKAREGRTCRWRRARVVTRAAVAIAVAIGVLALGASSRGVIAAQDAASTGKAKKYLATRSITVDKATGALRKPTTVETQELVETLTAMLKRSSEGLSPVTLPNGATVMNVEGRFAPVMLARPNADGTTEIRCVTTFEAALDFLGLVEDPSQQ